MNDAHRSKCIITHDTKLRFFIEFRNFASAYCYYVSNLKVQFFSHGLSENVFYSATFNVIINRCILLHKLL